MNSTASTDTKTAATLTAAQKAEAAREKLIAAARAEIDAADAKASGKPRRTASGGSLPDTRLMSDRKADPVPAEDEPAFAAEEPAAPVASKPTRVRKSTKPAKPAVKAKAAQPVRTAKPAAKPAAKATAKATKPARAAKPAAAPGKPAKAAKPAGVPAWQVDAEKTAANPIQGGAVLKLLKKGPLTDDQIRTALGKSHAWTNRTTLSLAHVGLTVRERDGRSIVNRIVKK